MRRQSGTWWHHMVAIGALGAASIIFSVLLGEPGEGRGDRPISSRMGFPGTIQWGQVLLPK